MVQHDTLPYYSLSFLAAVLPFFSPLPFRISYHRMGYYVLRNSTLTPESDPITSLDWK